MPSGQAQWIIRKQWNGFLLISEAWRRRRRRRRRDEEEEEEVVVVLVGGGGGFDC
jgi:hypothetical protein